MNLSRSIMVNLTISNIDSLRPFHFYFMLNNNNNISLYAWSWSWSRDHQYQDFWSKTKTKTKIRGFETKTKTKTFGSRPRPRPRPVKSGLECPRDQDLGLEDNNTESLPSDCGLVSYTIRLSYVLSEINNFFTSSGRSNYQ